MARGCGVREGCQGCEGWVRGCRGDVGLVRDAEGVWGG